MKQFTSKAKRTVSDKPPAPPKVIPFGLDKETFHITLRSDADSALEWSELAATAMLEGDADLESPEGAAFIARFFKLVMEPGEYRRFRNHMRVNHTDAEVLGEIMTSIQDEMEDVIEDEAERPTEQPSRSSTGRTAKDDRTLRIASIPDGDVEFVAPAPPEGSVATKPATRKRRRAG